MEFQDFLLELKVLSEETFRTEADFLLNGSNRGSESERKIHALAIGFRLEFGSYPSLAILIVEYTNPRKTSFQSCGFQISTEEFFSNPKIEKLPQDKDQEKTEEFKNVRNSGTQTEDLNLIIFTKKKDCEKESSSDSTNISDKSESSNEHDSERSNDENEESVNSGRSNEENQIPEGSNEENEENQIPEGPQEDNEETVPGPEISPEAKNFPDGQNFPDAGIPPEERPLPNFQVSQDSQNFPHAEIPPEGRSLPNVQVSLKRMNFPEVQVFQERQNYPENQIPDQAVNNIVLNLVQSPEKNKPGKRPRTTSGQIENKRAKVFPSKYESISCKFPGCRKTSKRIDSFLAHIKAHVAEEPIIQIECKSEIGGCGMKRYIKFEDKFQGNSAATNYYYSQTCDCAKEFRRFCFAPGKDHETAEE